MYDPRNVCYSKQVQNRAVEKRKEMDAEEREEEGTTIELSKEVRVWLLSCCCSLCCSCPKRPCSSSCCWCYSAAVVVIVAVVAVVACSSGVENARQTVPDIVVLPRQSGRHRRCICAT